MAASSSSAATVTQSDHSSLAEEPEAETEFCPGFKDVDAFVKVGWSFQCVNPAVSSVTNCKHKRNVERVAMRAYAVTFEIYILEM